MKRGHMHHKIVLGGMWAAYLDSQEEANPPWQGGLKS